MFGKAAQAIAIWDAARKAETLWSALPDSDTAQIEATVSTIAKLPGFMERFPKVSQILLTQGVPLITRVKESAANAELTKYEPPEDANDIIVRCPSCEEYGVHVFEKGPVDPFALAQNAVWLQKVVGAHNHLTKDGKALVDHVFRTVAPFLVKDEENLKALEYFVNNPDPLGTRLMGMFMYPGVKDEVLRRITPVVSGEVIIPKTITYVCAMCDTTHNLELSNDLHETN